MSAIKQKKALEPGEVWIGRHHGAPNICLVFDPERQGGLPKQHVRLFILHYYGKQRIGEEITGEDWRMRKLVRPEGHEKFARECQAIYFRLRQEGQ